MFARDRTIAEDIWQQPTDLLPDGGDLAGLGGGGGVYRSERGARGRRLVQAAQAYLGQLQPAEGRKGPVAQVALLGGKIQLLLPLDDSPCVSRSADQAGGEWSLASTYH